jgi:hypothetical protein
VQAIAILKDETQPPLSCFLAAAPARLYAHSHCSSAKRVVHLCSVYQPGVGAT